MSHVGLQYELPRPLPSTGYPTYDPAAYQQHAAAYGSYMASPYMTAGGQYEMTGRGYTPPTTSSMGYMNGSSYNVMYTNRYVINVDSVYIGLWTVHKC